MFRVRLHRQYLSVAEELGRQLAVESTVEHGQRVRRGSEQVHVRLQIPAADPTKFTWALPLGLSNPEEYEYGNLRR